MIISLNNVTQENLAVIDDTGSFIGGEELGLTDVRDVATKGIGRVFEVGE